MTPLRWRQIAVLLALGLWVAIIAGAWALS